MAEFHARAATTPNAAVAREIMVATTSLLNRPLRVTTPVTTGASRSFSTGVPGVRGVWPVPGSTSLMLASSGGGPGSALGIGIRPNIRTARLGPAVEQERVDRIRLWHGRARGR